MNNVLRAETAPQLCLDAVTAADLMTPNPVSIRGVATIDEAVALLIDKGISAAPVIDNAGRPVGVLSRSDILVHDRQRVEYLEPAAAVTEPGLPKPDVARAEQLMTPVVFSVGPQTPAHKVVEEMVALKVHRLFVVDRGGVLIGVISALDVLRHLRPEEA